MYTLHIVSSAMMLVEWACLGPQLFLSCIMYVNASNYQPNVCLKYGWAARKFNFLGVRGSFHKLPNSVTFKFPYVLFEVIP